MLVVETIVTNVVGIETFVTNVVEVIHEGPQGPPGEAGPAGEPGTPGGPVTDGTYGDITVTGNGNIWSLNQADYFQLDTTATPSGAVGRQIWDDTNGTVSLGLKGGNSTLLVGEQQYVRAVNDTGTTLTKGQVVAISGAQGNRVTVKLAQANNEANSNHTIGFVTESIANNGEGWILTSGSISGINTSAFTAGATVYLSPTTSGQLTATKPSAPNHLVILGFVQRSHATTGSIYIKVDNGYELEELHNVSITTPSAGDTLTYDASGLWQNKTQEQLSAQGSWLNGKPVIFNNLSDKDLIQYKAGTQRWENVPSTDLVDGGNF